MHTTLPFPEAPNESHDPLISPFSENEILAPLVHDFVASLPADVQALTEAIQSNETHVVQRLCHRLRGTAATYGYPSFANISAELESITEDECISSLNQDRRVGAALLKLHALLDRMNLGLRRVKVP